MEQIQTSIQKNLYSYLNDTIPSIHKCTESLVQHFSDLRAEAKDNVNQWKEALNLYPIK